MATTSAGWRCSAGNSRSQFLQRPDGGSDSLSRDRGLRRASQLADFSDGRALFDLRHHGRKFSVPHDAVEPVGYTFHAGPSALGYITDLGHATRLAIERLRQVQTLVIETNHDEKLLQNDPHRPWPVKQRIQSRHGHLSNTAAAAVVAQLLPGKIGRVVLGHLSRDCNSPELAAGTVRAELDKCGRSDIEIFCAAQGEISPRFAIGESRGGAFQPTFDNLFFEIA